MTKNKGGRPRKEIDSKEFEKLCALQCTQEEIAGFFDCDTDTIQNWCKRTYKKGFSEVFKQKRSLGAISLRRKQWQMADHSAAMAIFLGKNYLGQRDKFEIENNEALDKLDSILEEVKNGADHVISETE
jgi:hypothetical protein